MGYTEGSIYSVSPLKCSTSTACTHAYKNMYNRSQELDGAPGSADVPWGYAGTILNTSVHGGWVNKFGGSNSESATATASAAVDMDEKMEMDVKKWK
ncbi:hypothetical protein POVCU2_0037490 [Plasmodium ovale curtisi]|uniref:Uncharacterized protein n=1 Tax=Plasmodium ovale curtisi TaxID=864141 RepID=A0A1A8W145_PLAOA|nr:hypothetical protein POVCU2_0037490 [Plasmodium ovale curtisi]SBS96904.1 hypothetical protein POVCU1_034490 [Plasmodium ovale curtisi]